MAPPDPPPAPAAAATPADAVSVIVLDPVHAPGGGSEGRTPPSPPPRLWWRAALASSPHDATILGLALPALGSLMLDPILSLVDTSAWREGGSGARVRSLGRGAAHTNLSSPFPPLLPPPSGLVGRLGTEPLAAVGLSSIAFTFFAILFNFLIFVTTPAVAAAAARSDWDEVAAINARGLWVAAVCGAVSGVGLWAAAPMLARAAGATPTVAAFAVVYLRCRALACPALLIIFVACGAFRGVRDTRTPLAAAAVANAVNLAGDVFLMFGLGMGVAGAALATAASQYVSAGLLVASLGRRGMLKAGALRTPPTPASCIPLLRSGAALAVRNVATMSVILVGTRHVAALGAATTAAHEVMRQLYIASVQVFSALDVACQSLVATYVGGGDPASARAVIARGLQVGVAAGAAVGLCLAAASAWLPSLFTSDAAVAAAAGAVMPVMAAFMPVDAAAAVLEGGLLGASETAWVARCTILVSAACLAALLGARAAGGGLLGVWLSFKTLSVGRALAAGLRYADPGSPLGRDAGKKKEVERAAAAGAG